jgi:hypothetical protein
MKCGFGSCATLHKPEMIVLLKSIEAGIMLLIVSIKIVLIKKQLIDEKSFWCASIGDLCLFLKHYSCHLVYQ